jgi:hypothetical protein
MNAARKLTLGLLLTAATAFGNPDLTRIRDQAAQLEQEFADIRSALRCPMDDCEDAPPVDVQRRLLGVTAALDDMRKLIVSAERADPALAANAGWKRAKQAARVIDLSHARKSHFMVGAARDYRWQLEANADLLIREADVLRQLAGQLLTTTK